MGKISSYAAVVTPADADVVPVVQSGVTKKVALSVLKTYVAGTPEADATKADKVATSPDPTGYVATFDDDGNLDVSVKTVAGIGNVSSSDFSTIVKCTQAEYDAISPVDENTLYIIVEA